MLSAPHPSLNRRQTAELLISLKEGILHEWTSRCRKEFLGAQLESETELRDSIPDFLDRLAATLGSPAPATVVELNAEVARKHGEHRARQRNYTLDEVICEYHVLRSVILEFLEAHFPLAAKCLTLVHEFIDQGIRKSVVKYVEQENKRQAVQKAENEQIREELFNFFHRSSSPICLITGPEHLFAMANPAYIDLVQREVVGKTVCEVFGADDLSPLLEILDQAYRSGEKYTGKEVYMRYRDRHGKFRGRYLDFIYQPYRDRYGEVEGIQIIAQDVTEAVETRKSLEENRERLALALEAGRLGTWQVDLKTNQLTGSPQHAAIFGLPETNENLLERRQRLVHPKDRDRLNQAWNASIQNRTSFSMPYRIFRTDGVMRWIEVRGQVKYDRHGKPSLFLGVISDITEQKEAEEVRSQLFQLSRLDLEKLKAEREIREKFVSTLTHDLRNPLSAARTGAQLLLRYPDRIEVREKITTKIISSIDRADKMIRDLLDANRIHAGQGLPIQIKPGELQTEMTNLIEELSLIYGDRFIYRGEHEVHGYFCAESIRRVVENLATNAVKYGTSGTPITLCLSKCGQTIQISVHNQGNPLTIQEQKNIFELYQRTNSADQGYQKGWGLGLTLVRGIMDAHCGKVRVLSNAETGTTFTIEFPLDCRSLADQKAGANDVTSPRSP